MNIKPVNSGRIGCAFVSAHWEFKNPKAPKMFATPTTRDRPPKILRNPPFFDSCSGILGKFGSGIGAGAEAAPGITSIIGSLEVTAGTTSTAGFAGLGLVYSV